MSKDTGKESLYFSHDYNARSDPKIRRMLQKLGWESYGLWWAMVEDLYINGNRLPTDYEGMAYDLRADENTIKRIIEEFDLFKIEGNFFESVSIKRRLTKREEKSELAKLSAKKRWDKYYANEQESYANAENNDTNDIPQQSERNANLQKTDAKEIDSIDSIDSIDREIDKKIINKEPEKKNEKVFDLKENQIFDIENDLLKNQIQFERIGMAVHKKPEHIKLSLHKFHLHMVKTNGYPTSRKQAYAGFEIWLLNERNYNGSSPPENEKQKTGIPKNLKSL